MKLPKSFYSWTTISGMVPATVSFLLIVFTVLISFIFPTEGGIYLGLITFIILTVFLIKCHIVSGAGWYAKSKLSGLYHEKAKSITKPN